MSIYFIYVELMDKKNRPPVESHITSTTYKILTLLENRHIAMSRTGTISLSWPSGSEDDFEINYWWKKFQGIYLILHSHVLGEKSVLLELSNLSADYGKLLKLLETPEIFKLNLSETRKELFSLATLLTRYTIEMSPDDCGGLSEYADFFTTFRSIFGIWSHRNELREEIQDVLALVESTYLEEQRKSLEFEKRAILAEKRYKWALERIREKHQQSFDRLVAIISSIVLPLSIMGAIFGMNLTDLPKPPFWGTMFVTFGLGLFLFAVFMWVIMKGSSESIKFKEAIFEQLNNI